ncbi:MAG TPA: hypothetical protein PLK34_01190 [Candidatus Pacearchaeota archaeon]|nr:hypothetical protein [Candidatus Pacearchaeota archaeon]
MANYNNRRIASHQKARDSSKKSKDKKSQDEVAPLTPEQDKYYGETNLNSKKNQESKNAKKDDSKLEYSPDLVNGIFQYAVNKGIGNLVSNRPALESFRNYLSGKLDIPKLTEMTMGLIENANKNDKLKRPQKIEYIGDKLANYISKGIPGQAFKKESGAILGAKRSFFDFGYKRRQAYLENTVQAFDDLGLLLKDKDDQILPELRNQIKKHQGTRLIEPSLNVLRSYNLVKGKYNKELKEINKYQQNSPKQALESILGEYREKMAASFLGLMGLTLVALSNLNITGAVIGSKDYNSIASLIGAGLILVALCLFLKIRAKAKKVSRKPKAIASKKKSKKSSKAKKRR